MYPHSPISEVLPGTPRRIPHAPIPRGECAPPAVSQMCSDGSASLAGGRIIHPPMVPLCRTGRPSSHTCVIHHDGSGSKNYALVAIFHHLQPPAARAPVFLPASYACC